MYFNVNGGLSGCTKSYVATKVGRGRGAIAKLGTCLRPKPEAVILDIWVNRKSVKVKDVTLMYGQWALATGLCSLLAYCNKSPTPILVQKNC